MRTVTSSGTSAAARIAASLAGILLFSTVFAVILAGSNERAYASHSQCTDGIDNDNDGTIDYPQDNDCDALDDDAEGGSMPGNFLTVTDGRESITPGGALVYVITLKQQREDARLLNVSFHLPYQANIVSASDGGSVSSNMVQWKNVSVYRNVTRTLSVFVNVRPDAPAGQYIVSRVLTTGAEATDTTFIEQSMQPIGDLYHISLTDNHEYVLPGENLTYVVKVKNTGTRTQTNDVRLTLPTQIYFISNSANGIRNSYNVTWPNVTLAPDEEREFTATGQVDYRTQDKMIIRAKAYIGTAIDSEQTVVRIGLPYDAIGVSMTDNRVTAEVGQLLTYVVTVRNNSTLVGTDVNIDASLPIYAEFVSATEGGRWDGTNVRWLLMQVAPEGERRITYTVRVRSDAPAGNVLTASVTADGATARDMTTIGEVGSGGREGTVLFRKNADRSEVFPGGRIRYTLTVTNKLDHTVSDAIIVDRYDTENLTFVSATHDSQLIGNAGGEMRWQVPVLEPGQSWQTSYVLEVGQYVPASLELSNIATIKGSDLDGISLVEKVRTNSSGVLADAPSTGAGMDAILGLALALVALGVTGMQKKLSLLDITW